MGGGVIGLLMMSVCVFVGVGTQYIVYGKDNLKYAKEHERGVTIEATIFGVASIVWVIFSAVLLIDAVGGGATFRKIAIASGVIVAYPLFILYCSWYTHKKYKRIRSCAIPEPDIIERWYTCPKCGQIVRDGQECNCDIYQKDKPEEIVFTYEQEKREKTEKTGPKKKRLT